MSGLSYSLFRPPFLFYNFDKNNTTVVTIGTGNIGTSGAPELTRGLWRSLLSVLYIVDHCLSFLGGYIFFRPLYWLSFLSVLNTPLVSSKFSYAGRINEHGNYHKIKSIRFPR